MGVRAGCLRVESVLDARCAMTVDVFDGSGVGVREGVWANAQHRVFLVRFEEFSGAKTFLGLVEKGEIGYTGKEVEVRVLPQAFRVVNVGDDWFHKEVEENEES